MEVVHILGVSDMGGSTVDVLCPESRRHLELPITDAPVTGRRSTI